MPIIRYSPFQEIETLQRQMNRLFDDMFLSNQTEEQKFNFVPAAELTETDEALHLKLEIPGMDAKDLDIQVMKDTVSISGERKEETKTENNGVTRSEFRYGKFERVIPLPKKIQNTNVTADYKDGILTLTLPKDEEEQNRVFKVNLG
ncbi:heat shock protein Hsp20 [Gloeothece citriformis PCC 7424]|uniref:Heat shock protein Hsp20 n=1 Tax=Gloeothece citriformis (strain PCC 7424) TaxID=65393 RepID=B7KD55_GLOC7|nr:Hsp20/alpha crystallin family protein [Gloeothece citriformis]ACK73176.1 heat shock protein Hsp20 [Gloeothece citriformis PCC 7424]